MIILNSSANEAKEFCEQECGDAGTATIKNCCIWHYNIHACPQDEVCQMSRDMLSGDDFEDLGQRWDSKTNSPIYRTPRFIVHACLPPKSTENRGSTAVSCLIIAGFKTYFILQLF